MASDLSNIIKEELSSTLEQLLTKSSKVEEVKLFDVDTSSEIKCVLSKANFDFNDTTSSLEFYTPTQTATNFEYFMLGGIGDIKDQLDDETVDAVNEIISNICGSITTSTNAQGFPDISEVKSAVESSKLASYANVSPSNTYELTITLDDDKCTLLINFDNTFLQYISSITGNIVEEETPQASVSEDILDLDESEIHEHHPVSTSPHINQEELNNLGLLYNIKLKLSVRLGTKIFLLKDILGWDIGEIIELEQMVNEPLEILVNGVKIGDGEAVIVEGKFGLKVKNIGNNENILGNIGL